MVDRLHRKKVAEIEFQTVLNAGETPSNIYTVSQNWEEIVIKTEKKTIESFERFLATYT